MSLSRRDITAAARNWLGTPYHHRASLRLVGCDCIGLVRGLWRDLYGAEPEAPGPYTGDWAEATGNEALLLAAQRNLRPIAVDSAQPGDILIFRIRSESVAKHAAVLVEDGRMIHAQEGVPVSEVALNRWWRRRIAAAFALPGVTD